MKHKVHIWVRSIAISFGILLVITACTSAELKELESSASALQLTKGHEVSRSFQEKGKVLGKQQYAELRIDYEPIENYTTRDVYDEIVTLLENNNWKKDEINVVPDFYSGSLTQGEARLLVSVAIDPDRNMVRVELVNRNP